MLERGVVKMYVYYNPYDEPNTEWVMFQDELEDILFTEFDYFKKHHYMFIDFIHQNQDTDAYWNFLTDYMGWTETGEDDQGNVWVKPVELEWFGMLSFEEIEKRYISLRDRPKWEKFKNSQEND